MQLLLALLLQIVVQFMTQTEMKKIEAKCHQDVDLPCNADFKGKNYHSVTWYREKKQGIIRKNLKDFEIKLFDYPRNVSINEQNSLVLSKVTPADSDKYECAVSANVGGQNVNLFVELMVPECEPDETTVSMTTVDTEEAVETANRTSCVDCSDSAPHLPLTWSLVGYGAVALTKILLSTIIIWGFHIWTRRKRRW